MSVSLEDQLARLRISAAGTDLVVDDAQSPKKQFSILAIKKGWKGGDDSWKKAWLEVFKEDYPYGPRKLGSTETTDNSTSDHGGVILTQGEKDTEWESGSDSTDYVVVSSRGSPVPSESATPSRKVQKNVTPAFNDTADPMKTIENGMSQLNLAKDPPIGKKQRRNHRLSEELVSFLERFGSKLEGLQWLCQIVGIEIIPTSVTQCKEALKKVYVNIVNLLNYLRDPKGCPLIKFISYSHFAKYTRTHRMPLNEAKKNEIIKVLLRRTH